MGCSGEIATGAGTVYLSDRLSNKHRNSEEKEEKKSTLTQLFSEVLTGLMLDKIGLNKCFLSFTSDLRDVTA